MVESVLVALQGFHIAFLFLHDWIPLDRLNDVVSVRRLHTLSQLVSTTLLGGLPFALGLTFSWHFSGGPYPVWVRTWLWVTYGLLFLGELRAWWIPYLLWPESSRAARYQALFGHTHSFLPRRNGIVPNTLHVILHSTTFVTLLLLTRL